MTKIRDEVFASQLAKLPLLEDLPASTSSAAAVVGRDLAVFMGHSSAILFIAVSALGGIASVVRDRGSRELTKVLAKPRAGSDVTRENKFVVEHTARIVRAAWPSLIFWLLRTVGLAALLGVLIWTPQLSLWWGLGIFSTVLLGIALIKSLRRHGRAGQNDLRLSRRDLFLLSIGTAGTALAFSVGVAMMATGTAMVWMGGGAGMALIIPITLIGISLMTTSRKISRFFRRLIQPQIRGRIEADDRPPVLLLRSFADDNLEVRSSASSDSFSESLAGEAYSRFEEGLAWTLWRQGPVLTVGQPGTLLEPLGAAREYYSDGDWQDAISQRMTVAQVIAFVVGRSPSLRWEIDTVREKGYLAKSIFILPPVPRKEAELRLRVLCASLGLSQSVIPKLDQTWPLVLTFDAKGQPIIHCSKARTTSAYSQAITVGGLMASGQRSITLGSPNLRCRAADNDDVASLLERFDPNRKPRSRRTVASVLADAALEI